MRGYLFLIRKDSSTHVHGLAVYVKEGLPFAQDLSAKSSADSYLSFRLALLHSVSYFFFHYRSPSSALCTVFDSISLQTLMSIIRAGLPILVGLMNLVNSAIIFLLQMTLLRSLTFLLGSQTVILIILLFWIYFLLLMLVFVLQWLSLHWEILIMLLSQFPLTFQLIHNGMPSFWLRWSSWSFERCSMGGYL